ncbi:MAG: hypothetical protein IJ565_04735 [Bacilli bacterium]|nr:hypothetical protein [Bacilli bacterium]
MNMDTIKKTLEMNSDLSSGIKDNIFELVNILHSKLPEVDLTNLNNRLATLKVKKLNKFMSNNASMYDNITNTLYFNNEKINGECDVRHMLMFEILNISSSTDTQKGFIKDGKFEALNVGFTEILTNFLVGNTSDTPCYEEQAIETNLISIIIGSDIMKQAYFTNNPDLIIKGFADAGVQL